MLSISALSDPQAALIQVVCKAIIPRKCFKGFAIKPRYSVFGGKPHIAFPVLYNTVNNSARKAIIYSIMPVIWQLGLKAICKE